MIKRFVFTLLYITTLLVSSFANDSTKIVLKIHAPEAHYGNLFQLIGQVISNGHYRKLPIDDKLSNDLLQNYISHLDPLHLYLLQSDVDGFDKYKNKLDDDLMLGNAQAGFDMYNTYQTRLEQRINYTFDLLDAEIDFTRQDSFQYKREDAPFAKTIGELDKIWRNKIQFELLSVKTEGKDNKACADIIRKRYKNLLKQLSKTKNSDVFSFYANALTELADPHTNYMAAREADDFKTSMSLSLEGIGATLQTDNEYTKIASLMKGGPAEKSKLLSNNDKIVAVGQGKEGEMVSVLDWRIDDVVGLIRGKKGTLVRLEILAHDATSTKTKIVEIIRDKIVLEDQASKSEIKEVKRNGKKYKIGIIDIPTFYLDFERAQAGEKDYKSTTRDVRRIINEFKLAKVDGIVVDLRNNGGGSLQEAIELTGLFIKSGAVVQVKDAYGIVKPEKDNNEEILWDGPLEVIVNRFSASASEIFAAAMQDYGRALIVGEQTYGKGTVQNVIDLNQFLQIEGKKMGQVKITLAKFYRISGGSTQHKGVMPDIAFPSLFAGTEYGEGASKYALPYDMINAQPYTQYGNILESIDKIKAASDTRMKSSMEYAYLLEDIDEINKAKDKLYITVNEDKYKAELKQTEDRNKERKAAREKVKTVKGKNADFILDESEELMVDLITLKKQ